MPKWTNEQLQAITLDGTNIIVSAGAGSGKTAVLSERVITKLQKNIKINEMLILTFTNAAASEMKERIRKKMTEHEELKDNLLYLDTAYITTFDSYTLSLVKKYHYILGISPNISIVSSEIISLVKEEVLTQVFTEFYQSNNPLFKKLINDLTIKNDTTLKNNILKIIKSLENISDIDNYLDNYENIYLSQDKINNYIEEYLNIMHNYLLDIESNLYYIEELNKDYYDKLLGALEGLLKAKSYEDYLIINNLSLPRRPKDSEEIKEYKDNIDKIIKELKNYIRFNNTTDIIDSFTIMKDYITVIIMIIKRYLELIRKYKNNNNVYEFSDIAKLAIKLLKDNYHIKEEIKNSFKEIEVDEYQDTNDLQEEFINLISNNNVYMVGDIKQSIYGFRNANPKIFKDKYDNYANNNGGIKIDLLKNFRSRKEVLEGINEIFSHILDNTYGGCDYVSSHQMVYGNDIYEQKGDQNYNLELLNYDSEGYSYTKEEIEAFMVADDIKNKIANNYQVIDKNTQKLRNVTYDDFCLILDRGTSFPTIKKIFEYLQINLSIYEDKKLTNEIDIMLINNLIGLILKIKNNLIDQEFKYYYTSIMRSYLTDYNDADIFKIIKDNNYSNTFIYDICLEISQYNTYNNYEIINMILDKFNFYENLIKVGNIEDAIIRINNLLDIALNLNDLGYTLEEFHNYLTTMIKSKNEIKYKGNNTSSNSVKMMNIHKSKGLEFPICYFLGFSKDFNVSDIKERFIYDNTYGIITPYFNEGIGTSILKDLVKNKYMVDNIGEEIRLLYVALTRAKEKIIIVTSMKDNYGKVTGVVDNTIRSKYHSFQSILDSIALNLKPYINNINLDTLNLTKAYLFTKDNEFKNNNSNKVVEFKNIHIDNDIKNNKRASKEVYELLEEKDKLIIQEGLDIHKYFEETDFLNISKTSKYYDNIKYLIDNLNIDKDSLIYKEHEFIFEDDNIEYHGIIDLIIENKDIINIVDYKLKNIDDPKYLEQLKVYYNYIKLVSNKKIKLYLYSIINNELKEVVI